MLAHGLCMRADQLQWGHRLKTFVNSHMWPSSLGSHLRGPRPGGGEGAKCCGLAVGRRLVEVRLGVGV